MELSTRVRVDSGLETKEEEQKKFKFITDQTILMAWKNDQFF